MKKKEKLEKVLIIGGGTAGYFSALYLKKYLEAEICLVESPDIPTVGAGEASIPSMVDFLKELQIDEESFLKRTHGTFKMGIEYHHWTCGERKQPIYHPFYSSIDTHPFLREHYYMQKAKGLSSSLARESYPFIKYLHQNKAPRNSLSSHYQWQLPYAYHFDNHKLAAFLKELAIQRGIQYLSDTVSEVKLDKDGAIQQLITTSQKQLEADFYIDCSGFKGRLIQQALKSPVCDLQDYIFTDCALAVKLPYEDVNKQRVPYTIVRGMKGGWMWQIPLYEEVGYGYVHSKKYLQPSEALEELISYLPVDKVENPAFIPMKNFYLEKMWIKNCLAIGLSAGFIEPLESTGLFFITQALNTLRTYLPTPILMEAQAKNFNEEMKELYEQVLAFICLHYQYTPREDSPFWKDQKLNAKPHEYLQKFYHRYVKHYGRIDTPDESANPFHDFSYALFFDSFNILPEALSPHCYYPKWLSYQKQLKQLQEKRLKEAEKLPTQDHFLQQLHKIPVAR